MKFPQTLEERRRYKEHFQKIESKKIKTTIVATERKPIDFSLNALLGFGS